MQHFFCNVVSKDKNMFQNDIIMVVNLSGEPSSCTYQALHHVIIYYI